MIDGLPNAAVYGQTGGVFPWPPPLRSKPLPAFPGPVDYSTTLITPPPGPDNNYVRANFCGTRVPGLVWQYGMAGGPTDTPILAMDLDIFKYDEHNHFLGDVGASDSHDLIFAAKIRDGNTHFQFSIDHAAERGWTIDEVVALINKWRSLGGYADVWWLGAAAFARRDMDWAYYQPILQPWLEAIAPISDSYCVGWQLDYFNTGVGLVSIIRGLGDTIRKIRKALGLGLIKAACHWVRDACAWWDEITAKFNPPIGNRQQFHQVLGSEDNLHRDYLQVDVKAPPAGDGGGYQGVMRDLNSAHVNTPQGMQTTVLYEQFAQAEFDDPTHNTDEYGCMRGYLSCCVPNGGYGNGAYRPDRSAV